VPGQVTYSYVRVRDVVPAMTVSPLTERAGAGTPCRGPQTPFVRQHASSNSNVSEALVPGDERSTKLGCVNMGLRAERCFDIALQVTIAAYDPFNEVA
jgi:hypothetical protein